MSSAYLSSINCRNFSIFSFIDLRDVVCCSSTATYSRGDDIVTGVAVKLNYPNLEIEMLSGMLCMVD